MKKFNKNTLYDLALSHIISKIIILAAKMRLDEKLKVKPILITKLARHYKYQPQAMYR